MKEYQEKALGKLKDEKKILIKEVKLLRRKTMQAEGVNTELFKEFESLKEIMQRTKDACQNDV